MIKIMIINMCKTKSIFKIKIQWETMSYQSAHSYSENVSKVRSWCMGPEIQAVNHLNSLKLKRQARFF